jgi:hypothetical protein
MRLAYLFAEALAGALGRHRHRPRRAGAAALLCRLRQWLKHIRCLFSGGKDV